MPNPSNNQVLIVPPNAPPYYAIIHRYHSEHPERPTGSVIHHPAEHSTGVALHNTIPLPIPRPADGVSFGFVLLLVGMIVAAFIMVLSLLAIFSPRDLLLKWLDLLDGKKAG